jgi:hypothetical protein
MSTSRASLKPCGLALAERITEGESETFAIDGGIIGVSKRVPVTVPNVVIAKPGSTGTIELDFSSTTDTATKANLESHYD